MTHYRPKDGRFFCFWDPERGGGRPLWIRHCWDLEYQQCFVWARNTERHSYILWFEPHTKLAINPLNTKHYLAWLKTQFLMPCGFTTNICMKVFQQYKLYAIFSKFFLSTTGRELRLHIGEWIKLFSVVNKDDDGVWLWLCNFSFWAAQFGEVLLRYKPNYPVALFSQDWTRVHFQRFKKK